MRGTGDGTRPGSSEHKMAWDALTSGEKARAFKHMYGATDRQIGKRFCTELIDYYNKL